MMNLDEHGNYSPWRQPQYGKDASDSGVVVPIGYELIRENGELRHGDVPFDVYSGWLIPEKLSRDPSKCKYPDLRYNSHARSDGRWTTWARPASPDNS